MNERYIACATCHVKASKFTEPDGTVWWGHPNEQDPAQRHKCIPREHKPSEIIYLCDFCLELGPKWAIPLLMHANTTKWEPNMRLNVTALDTDAWWAACDTCKELISAGKRKELRDRALAPLFERLPDATQWEVGSIMLQLNAFWAATPGPAIEASLLDD